jgi:hypothetical protein
VFDDLPAGIQIDFDTSIVSRAQILNHIWESHRPFQSAGSGQLRTNIVVWCCGVAVLCCVVLCWLG